jgi:phenylalanyl-tRNA synthetase beta chain
VKRLTGLDLPRAEAKVILTELGFTVAGNAANERVKVLPPSWRPDIEGKADLVEEVVRVAGLERVVSQPLPRIQPGVAKPILTPLQKRTRLAKRELSARGLVEAVTWSFIAHGQAKLFGGGARALQLANPIAADLSDMRPSLLPGLVKAAQRNADRGFADVALFEVGQCFASDEPEGQAMHAAAIRRGTARATGTGRHWDGAAKAVDVFDAKADAMALLAALGIPAGGLQVVPGGSGLAPPRPVGEPAIRPAHHHRVVRRGSSAHPQGARCKGPARRVRDRARSSAAAEIPTDEDEAEARPRRPSAGPARLRLRGRPGCRGRRGRARGRECRTRADRRGHTIRHL